MSLSGHLWTIWPSLRHRVAPLQAPPSVRWQTVLDDPDVGPVGLSGRWSPVADAKVALLVVHGLGGSYDRPYCVRAARAASTRGWSCLRLALRGADGCGEDFYHAGLVADVQAALSSSPLADHEHVFVLGYSLGGHLALRTACEKPPSSMRAVAAVCPPLDLEATCRTLDDEVFVGYRRHLLTGLIATYAQVAQRRPVPTPLERVRRAKRIREFDSLTVVPRFGFSSAEDYYARESVAPRLASLACPTLVCASLDDPIVPPGVLRHPLAQTSHHLEVRWVRGGGHVSFPPTLDLGYGEEAGLEPQILAWMSTQRPTS